MLCGKLYDSMRQLLSRLDHVSFLVGLDNLFKKSDPPRIHEATSDATAAHATLRKLYDDTDIYLPSAQSGRVKEFLDTTSIPSTDTHTLFAGHFTREMVGE